MGELSVSWESPGPLAEKAMELAGLDFLSAIVAGELPPPPISELLGFHITEVEEGRAVFSSEPGEQHYNPIGVVHAGLALTMLDSAMACAVHSTCGQGTGYTTLETKVNLVAAVTSDTGPVAAEGRILQRGRRVATAEGRLTAFGSGKLLAHGTSTCLILGG